MGRKAHRDSRGRHDLCVLLLAAVDLADSGMLQVVAIDRGCRLRVEVMTWLRSSAGPGFD